MRHSFVVNKYTDVAKCNPVRRKKSLNHLAVVHYVDAVVKRLQGLAHGKECAYQRPAQGVNPYRFRRNGYIDRRKSVLCSNGWSKYSCTI